MPARANDTNFLINNVRLENAAGWLLYNIGPYGEGGIP